MATAERGKGVRLSPVETRRVAAVLDDALEKLAFLGRITPDVLQHRDELSRFVGDEISRILLTQRDLEERYEALIAQRSALKGMANKTKYKQVQAEIQDVSSVLRDSTRNLCRSLKDNPNISENLFKIQRDRNKLIALLQQTLEEIRGNRSFDGLRREIEQEQLSQDRLAVVQQRERHTSAAVRQLEARLSQEQAEYEGQIHQKQLAIAALKEELHAMRAQTMVDTRYFRREANARATAVTRTFRFEAQELSEQIKEMEAKAEMEAVVHEETMNFLKRKQARLDQEKSEWESKHETELHELEEKCEHASHERGALLERLMQLKKRREAELAIEARERAERERLDMEEQTRKDREELEGAASLKIQRAMRAWIARVAAAKAAKKASKGKKGSKGKKAKK